MSPIRRALLSVSDKTDLLSFAQSLQQQGVEILSTGGTAKFLQEQGVSVVDVSTHTGFPEMMDGRLKTLHPKIHGGLLGLRDHPDHQRAMQEHTIAPIDLLVVNLYPFEATVARGAPAHEVIENIDIGGPAMLRSAAKNHASVTVVTEPADYAAVLEEMAAHKGATTVELRTRLAAKVFARTAAYDAAIAAWFAAQAGDMLPERLALAGTRKQALRYGENPHQKAAFYVTGKGGIASAQQLQGKELSFNNIHDADAAVALVAEFDAPAAAIIKHANPCGVATAATLQEAYSKALASDPVSAFGGIIALNRPLDAATAKLLHNLFVEVILAPDFSPEAQAIFADKPNVRLLALALPDPRTASPLLKTVTGGFLVQESDILRVTPNQCTVVTAKAPTAAQLEELCFAFTLVKHVKSNAIVVVRDNASIGIGGGQTSRVDAMRQALAQAGEKARGAVLASDAFFPFPDTIELAAAAGITAIIQPGGSMRDAEVVEAANKHGIIMVTTGVRHFKH